MEQPKQWYRVELYGVPHTMPPQERAELETALKDAINAQYAGGEAEASGALVASRNEDTDVRGITPYWPLAVWRAKEQLADRMPAGARLHFAVNWQAHTGE